MLSRGIAPTKVVIFKHEFPSIIVFSAASKIFS